MLSMLLPEQDRKADMSASALQGGPRLMGKDQSMQVCSWGVSGSASAIALARACI